ncbi:MAG: DMT family transporter [Bacteroidales bacterium]|nr:DMT family transporter [Bacteroidales bacterium]
MPQKQFIIYISVITAVVLWGFSFIWTNSLLLQGFPVYSLVFFRMSIAAIILSIISFSARKIEKVRKEDHGWFLLLVLLEPFIYFIGETFGLKIVNSPTLGSIIISTIPIFALVAGIVFYRERVTAINIFGITITLPGILLVVFEGGAIDVSHYAGIVLLFVAVFSAVGYSVVVKKLAGRYNSYTIVTYQHILGALYFLPLFLYNDFSTFTIKSLTPEVIKPLFYLAILCSGVAFILFINSIKILGIARANIFTSLVPVVSAFGAFILGHDMMNIRKIAGIVIVVLGVIIAQRQKKTIPDKKL